jgi:hypothetical protein
MKSGLLFKKSLVRAIVAGYHFVGDNVKVLNYGGFGSDLPLV